MLRVVANQSSKAAKEYYGESLSRGDYYTENQEIVGHWRGIGAEKLGLLGHVEKEAYDALCENTNPATQERLTLANRDNRRVGYDFNFHCPKSVSIVYELTRDTRVFDVFKDALHQTMQDMEAKMKTRIRTNGANVDRTTGNMVWAEFFHFTARPVNGLPDPHLHAHCFVFNATWDSVEQRWKAGQFAELKAGAPYFEAIFHSRLSSGLAALGYGVERNEKGWEIQGIPQTVIEKFSQRTALIEKIAAQLGITSPEEKAELAAITRERKQKDLSKQELREIWNSRLTEAERSAVQNVKNRPSSDNPRITAKAAMEYAVLHCFERASVVSERELIRESLKYGVGQVSLEDVQRHLYSSDFIKYEENGERLITTKGVLAEEKRLIDFVRDGRGRFKPFNPAKYDISNSQLSEEQRNAVMHILRSMDRVTAIRGGAGTGKTTMMKEAVQGLESAGRKVFTFAPSAEASRGVLRSDAGFANAETVEALLQSSKLQEQVRGNVLWIDEAGLLSCRTLLRITELADRENCRIILSGDTAQHRAVERGDALRLLEKEANLKAAELNQIRRQHLEAHKQIVLDLREGRLEAAFAKLNVFGMIQELQGPARYAKLASDYVQAILENKTALVISPTHKEGERVTLLIRLGLKVSRRLGAEEREVHRLKNLQWTEAQKSDSRNYRKSHIIQFHQNAFGFSRGERVRVEANENGNLIVQDIRNERRILNLLEVGRFQVYESAQMPLAAGDLVRITQNSFSKDGKRLNNGELRQVKGFTKEGEIEFTNGAVLPRDFGHLTHGYCLTSYSSQSKGVDRVFIAESSDSFRAADREQFYVSASRFKEALTIYTDDKQELLAAVSKSSTRPLATELARKNTARKRKEKRLRKLQRRRRIERHQALFNRKLQSLTRSQMSVGQKLHQEKGRGNRV